MVKILLWVLLGLVALIFVLLHFSVKIHVKLDNESLDVKVKYLFFDIYPRPEKNKKKKFKKTKNTKKNSSKPIDDLKPPVKTAQVISEEPPKTEPLNNTQKQPTVEKTESRKEIKNEKHEPTLREKLNAYKEKWLKIKPYVPTTWKSVKKLLKTIRFTHTDIELTTGKEDAYESAMLYGKVNAGLYNGLAVLGEIFTIHYKATKVNCAFNEDVFDYRLETQVSLRPSAVIAIAFCTFVNYLKIYLKQRKTNEKFNETESAKK